MQSKQRRKHCLLNTTFRLIFSHLQAKCKQIQALMAIIRYKARSKKGKKEQGQVQKKNPGTENLVERAGEFNDRKEIFNEPKLVYPYPVANLSQVQKEKCAALHELVSVNSQTHDPEF